MKKSIITFSFFCFLMCIGNSIHAQKDVIVVLEKSFAVEQLQKYFEKDEAGKMLPFTVVTNNKFSEVIDLDFKGQKLELFKSKGESDLKEREAFVDVRKFKIRGNVSTLKFRYKGRKFKIKLRYLNDAWVFQSITVRGGGDYYKHVDLEY